jgi:hypothetical protein
LSVAVDRFEIGLILSLLDVLTLLFFRSVKRAVDHDGTDSAWKPAVQLSHRAADTGLGVCIPKKDDVLRDDHDRAVDGVEHLVGDAAEKEA